MTALSPEVLRRYVLHNDRSPEEEEALSEHIRVLMCRLGQVMAALAMTTTLLWWPLDFVFYLDDPPLFSAFVTWRSVMLVCAVSCLLLLRGPGRTHPVVVMLVSLMIAFASAGWALGALAPRAGPWLSAVYLLPLAPSVFTVKLPARIVTCLLTPLSFGLAFLERRRDFLDDPALLQITSVTAFSALMSIMVGHMLYHLVRENFFAQQALGARTVHLEELDRVRGEFFANVSHELRTPLTLILASFRRLKDLRTAPEVQEAVGPGLRNTARLLTLINELLDLARFDAHRSRTEKRRIDVATLVRRVVANFQSVGEEPHIRVEGTEVPAVADADPRQLRKALYNLLGNAVKFTDPVSGRVVVKLERGDDEIIIRVKDNGIGIAPEHHALVFERFAQVEGGPSRRQQGSGIGLALVKEIMEAHGGRVTLESRVGAGSTFTLYLPTGITRADVPVSEESAEVTVDDVDSLYRLAQGKPQQLPPMQLSPREGPAVGTVLLVEDDAELRQYAHSVLAARFDVVEAANGEDALKAMGRQLPDVVVTDAMMPRMSGHDLLKALRADPSRQHIPVLFLTARTEAAARLEALTGGANDYVSKPFEDAELLARVENLCRMELQRRQLVDFNRELEARVEARTRELRDLAQHITELQEDERRRIAAEIHDELGQLLTALRMELDHLAAQDEAGRFSRAREVLDQTFTSARDLVGQLRPRVLDDLGLAAGAGWLLERFAERTQLPTDWDIELRPAPVPPTVATAVFRTLQEALTNIMRHAKAKTVFVRLTQDDGGVHLVVKDDGVGFDATRKPHRRFGVVGMRERAAVVGGTLMVESAPGAGTSLTMVVPAAALEGGA